MSYHIIVTTQLSEAGFEILRDETSELVQISASEPIHDHLSLVTAEALIIRHSVRVDKSLLDAAPQLRVIGRVGSGFAGIDVDEATRRGIIVMNTPGMNATSVAEYTLAMLLALARPVVQGHNQLRSGDWKRDELLGSELHGKILGLIGLGNVGYEVAKRATAFGMQVLVNDPYVLESRLESLPVKLVGLPELLSSADVISVHCSVTPETHRLLNHDRLGLVKPGALLLNLTHESLIDEDALLPLLDNGMIAGVALDVFARDPVSGSSLRSHPRVLHTPRLADYTHEAQHKMSEMIAQQVLDALHGQDFRNVINMPLGANGQPFEEVAPYMRLAETIGRLQYYLADGPIQRVLMEFKGEEFLHLIKPVTVATLRGILAPMLGEDKVNYINAPLLAHEHHITVSQAKGLDSTHYTHLLSCRVQWADGSLVVAGALFNHTDPHIVQIDQYQADIMPEGIMLIIGSYDVPGVIGCVGQLLADNQINIADWRTGRAERGGQTLSVVTLDEPLSDEILATLRSQEYIRHARQIIL